MDAQNVQEVIDEIKATTDLLYQENMQEGYGKLSAVLHHINDLTVDITDTEEQERFVEILKPALEAMEAQDMTLLADVLQYELVPKLEEYL
ncbi:MAG: hypothetical protein K2G89_02950 [Lachnospiraceae bacterium]|nr:hypothetical protein [Lachnospiraceae bacterium]